jgi:hypothetical protein
VVDQLLLTWRFDEDGSLKVKEPKKSDYDYYYYKDVVGKKVECPLCGRVVDSSENEKHQATKDL